MKKLIFIFSILLSYNSFSQIPTFSEDIAPILYNKCTQCHHSGGISPFNLISYNEVSSMSSSIVLSVVSGEMPPWPVDSTYQTYSHERILNIDEINKIVNWSNGGSPEGDPTIAPNYPTYTSGSILPNPDFVLNMPVYTSNASSTDEYVCFKVETNFATDKWIKAVEIIPGNIEIVHHALAFIDTDGGSGITTDCMGSEGNLFAGYTPGSEPTIFPNGNNVKMGVLLPAGASINVQMHYPEGSAGMIDSTKLNFFFYPDGTSGIRQVYTDRLLEKWDFYIPANSTPTFNTRYPTTGTTSQDWSILSVFPHMHLIGKEITSFAVTPTNDTIPFERIKNWDFEWQGFYNFKNILKIPTGSVMYAEATFDNTSNNPHNPNDPPQLILPGESTTDEMFLVFFQYLPYEQGDENLILDDLLSVGFTEKTNFKKLDIYPNPTSEFIKLNHTLNEKYEYKIINMEGKIVQQEEIEKDQQISVKHLKSGNYIVLIINKNTIYNGKFIKE